MSTALAPIIGFTGKMNAGKDTALARLVELFGARHYQRASFADPMKKSVGALLNLTVHQIDEMKNDPNFRINIVHLRAAPLPNAAPKGVTPALQEFQASRSQGMREFLQRYGTESHRDIFGQDFWVTHSLNQLEESQAIHVYTDVRFENEAQAIVDRGGLIFEIRGPDVLVASSAETEHVSEDGVSEGLVSGYVDNSHRPQFEQLSQGGQVAADAINASVGHLDDELAKLHGELWG